MIPEPSALGKNSATQPPRLEVRSLGLRARDTGTQLVRDVSFSVEAGMILGIVGASGSGKTLTSFAVAGLLPRNVLMLDGMVFLDGQRIDNLPPEEARIMRGGSVGIVFQDPLSSLNPVRTVGSILIESMVRHQGISSGTAREQAIQLLREMRLPGANASIDAYPHMLSGGQRQRVMIALALANGPGLLIADEPTTALDPTIQLQILALIKQKVAKSACILVTHDLAAAAAVCDRILVMNEGTVVEEGDTNTILQNPTSEYAKTLVSYAGFLSPKEARV
jgi:ABC-type glutathione transport system ATPase component